MKKQFPLLIASALLTTGCSLVKLSPQADHVRLMTAKSASHCKVIGTTTVSVLDKILFFERDKKTILEELEILARNSAAKLGGDTASPDGAPVAGEQSYTVYQCIYGGH
ncbi:MAG: DUF4156 domain-containing protein [Candidatus Polarisedimenticolaceae bacterium]|nr:DUF4156 domain-containing protein [Candidatus Polarisedimenticolaceae bacterium]